MQQSLVSFYAFVGAWGVGLVALPLLRPLRLDARPQMRSLICAFNDSDNASSGNAPADRFRTCPAHSRTTPCCDSSCR